MSAHLAHSVGIIILFLIGLTVAACFLVKPTPPRD